MPIFNPQADPMMDQLLKLIQSNPQIAQLLMSRPELVQQIESNPQALQSLISHLQPGGQTQLPPQLMSPQMSAMQQMSPQVSGIPQMAPPQFGGMRPPSQTPIMDQLGMPAGGPSPFAVPGQPSRTPIMDQLNKPVQRSPLMVGQEIGSGGPAAGLPMGPLVNSSPQLAPGALASDNVAGRWNQNRMVDFPSNVPTVRPMGPGRDSYGPLHSGIGDMSSNNISQVGNGMLPSPYYNKAALGESEPDLGFGQYNRRNLSPDSEWNKTPPPYMGKDSFVASHAAMNRFNLGDSSNIPSMSPILPQGGLKMNVMQQANHYLNTAQGKSIVNNMKSLLDIPMPGSAMSTPNIAGGEPVASNTILPEAGQSSSSSEGGF